MIMKISSGEFKHKIELQVVTNKKVNGFLEEVTETVYNGRAKIVNIIKTETNNGTGELTVDSKKFYIRYARKLDDVEYNLKSKKYRLIYNGKAYNILAFSDVQESHEYFEIITERVGTLL